MKRGIFHKRSKKAQAAMEFLMTYGWALFVVLVVFAALAFFGILRYGKFLPDSCVMFAGVTCVQYIADGSDNQIRLAFHNGLGYDMKDVAVSVTLEATSSPLTGDASNGATDCTGGGLTLLREGSLLCGYAYTGTEERLKGEILLSWTQGITPRARTGSFVLVVNQ